MIYYYLGWFGINVLITLFVSIAPTNGHSLMTSSSYKCNNCAKWVSQDKGYLCKSCHPLIAKIHTIVFVSWVFFAIATSIFIQSLINALPLIFAGNFLGIGE